MRSVQNLDQKLTIPLIRSSEEFDHLLPACAIQTLKMLLFSLELLAVSQSSLSGSKTLISNRSSPTYVHAYPPETIGASFGFFMDSLLAIIGLIIEQLH